MSYLEQFQKHLSNHDFPSFLSLWEEYCLSDEVDGEELITVLTNAKNSELHSPFGRHVEQGLVLWEKITDDELSQKTISLIFDIQTTNGPELAEIALNYLNKRYGNDPHFQDKLRLIGLREQQNFQGAISNYILLTHMKKGNFVLHNGEWGVGEIMDVSFIREELSLEFDYVLGVKDLSFSNAFHTLIPLPDTHFLALRFGNPDALEVKAKKNPVETIHILLRDLGPKTAAEIKDELCDLVIPSSQWARWWQTARAKVKKDTMIESPEKLSGSFRLRKIEISHEERFEKALESKMTPHSLIQMVYAFLRDFPQTIKNQKFNEKLQERLKDTLSTEELSDAEQLQFLFFLQDLTQTQDFAPIKELILRFTSPEEVIKEIDPTVFKKRALAEVRELRSDWVQVFSNLFLITDQGTIREYILNELIQAKHAEKLNEKIRELLSFPGRYPQALVWYFQKIMKNSEIPFGDPDGKNQFFEAFLILLSLLEQSSGHRDLIKKMHNFLTTGRYSNVRKIFKHASQPIVREFLLLATKCHSLSDHDIKIFHSLAEVVHPALAKLNKKYKEAEAEAHPLIWTTEAGYKSVKDRIDQISTVETVANAKEIEVARGHGDLRENAEFKAALEKRDRLQSELKLLSGQFSQARILTKDDVTTDKVGVGVIVDLEQDNGAKVSYTLLGPWDADPDKHILSLQSKLAQSLLGKKVGDEVMIQGKAHTILSLRNYFDTV